MPREQTAALHELTAATAAALIRKGEVSSEELVAACLSHIEARDPEIRAWAHLDGDAALEQARARDGAAPIGPLHGVPVGVKDIFDTGDMPTAYGSSIYAGHRPDTDAASVESLRAAGAVILGKTVTSEFASFEPGPTRNPHATTHTPGGSSSGSAAAVADDMVPLALGTQTAASTIRPASYCGVLGYKPTFGAVPLAGVRANAPSLDTVGIFAREVDDLLLCARALGVDVGESILAERPRIAMIRAPWDDRIDADAAEVIEAALDGLRDRAEVVDHELNGEADGLVAAQTAIMDAEFLVSMAHEREHYPRALSARLTEKLRAGDAIDATTLAQARALAERCRIRIDEEFADFDIVLAHAVTGVAPRGMQTGDPSLCRAWTLLGVPAVAVPGLRGADGLPLGVQVLAPRGREDAVLAGARWLADAFTE